MTQRKRSTSINLSQMRKVFSPKPLALGVAAVCLTACGEEKQDATIYTSANDCINDNPDAITQCTTAYEEALKEAERTAPRYNSQQDCEYDFGVDRCRTHSSGGGSFFIPFMAGYMISDLLSPRRYYTRPMFSSSSRYSPYRYRWVGADGYDYGDLRRRKMRVGKNTYAAKPAASRTIKRGGFGSSVRAKSSWGSSRSSSSRRGGWGG